MYKTIKLPNGEVVKEHRHIMSEYLGRPLQVDEHVHHLDGDTWNNNISNLLVISPKEHRQLHALYKRAESLVRNLKLKQEKISRDNKPISIKTIPWKIEENIRMPNQFVREKAILEYFKISSNELKRWIKKEMPYIKIFKTKRFNVLEIEEWLQKEGEG